ncbi:MAG: hypothetical protein EKK37_04740 [Sphingobacteriales bacterium]|nr:MAG: hypothetical protein EKK37_04740 [Sphingobacteriales bacterium]
MVLCLSIEQFSALVSIVTPLVLIFWFRYIRKQNFNSEFIGIYANYLDSEPLAENKGRKESGLIMNIRDILSSGYFRGEFDYRENISTQLEENMLRDGMFTFYGKINYNWSLSNLQRLIIPGNPLKAVENRTYTGKLIIVMRLDFQIHSQNIETFTQEEYNFIYYRELRVLEFKLSKPSNNQSNNIPKEFLLHKSFGLAFEPYKNVKEIIFRGFTRTDIK